jgi:hypothetical protein
MGYAPVRHLTPSDIRRRAERKAKRSILAAQGLLPQHPKTFRYWANRLNRRRSVFESPSKQQDLNMEICCSAYNDAPMEFPGGRISVLTANAEALAAELVAKGWTQL